MEQVLQTLGVIGFVFLVVVGALAGLLAALIQGGRNMPRNITIGIIGAVSLPLLVALIAAGALAAGGLLLIFVIAVLGAVAVLVIAQLITRR